jgi:hypothetical protein
VFARTADSNKDIGLRAQVPQVPCPSNGLARPCCARSHIAYFRGPVPLIAPSLEIGLGSSRQKHAPSLFEIGAGLVECGCRAVGAFPQMGARIEAACPSPWILVEGNTGANFDDAGVDIAPIDVPAFLRSVSRSTAGELGHLPLKRIRRRSATSLGAYGLLSIEWVGAAADRGLTDQLSQPQSMQGYLCRAV